jgi:hypothetical protein
VTAYDELIAAADEDYANGRFKDAHIKYGCAQSLGTARNHYCRQMRGICSRRVAEERLRKAVEHPDFRQDFLEEAARWLAKSEANLNSAFDESPEVQLGNIRLEQAQTEEAIARFVEMSGGNPARRLSAARTFREEGFELLARS